MSKLFKVEFITDGRIDSQMFVNQIDICRSMTILTRITETGKYITVNLPERMIDQYIMHGKIVVRYEYQRILEITQVHD